VEGNYFGLNASGTDAATGPGIEGDGEGLVVRAGRPLAAGNYFFTTDETDWWASVVALGT